MDDDAEPNLNALEKIFENAKKDKGTIFGSAAIHHVDGATNLCFPVKRMISSKTEIIDDYDRLADKELVIWLPFLGFLINRCVVITVGFPDKDFFIRNDDIEYAERLKMHGIKIVLIKESIIKHPFQTTVTFNLFKKPLYYRSMPPWKMYYETRNKLIIARRYYNFSHGIKMFFGISLQVFLSLFFETKKRAYLKSYFLGILQGIKHKPLK